MGIPLSDQYFLKAQDKYDYDISETIEALNYSISYDDAHAGAHCLYGQVYTWKLKRYDLARHHFELALLYESDYTDTYYTYPYLLVQLGDYRKAHLLLRTGMRAPGINPASLVSISAYAYEHAGKLDLAKATLRNAQLATMNDQALGQVSAALKRVNKKLKITTERR